MQIAGYEVQKITKYLPNTGTYSASTTLSPLDVPREGIITEVQVRMHATATLTATAPQDSTRRVLDTLRIAGDNITFLGLDAGGGTATQLGRLLALLNQFDCGGAATRANVADIGTTGFDQCFVFHPGSNPKDPFDVSAGIPASKLATLQATIGCPAATACDANATLTGTYLLTISEVLGWPIFPNMMQPVGYTQVWSPDGNYASWGKLIDVPAGSWLRRIIIMVQDQTPTNPWRTDALVTGLSLSLPKTSQTFLQAYVLDLKAMMSRRYRNALSVEDGILGATAGAPPSARPGFSGAAFMPLGFYIIDLRDYFDPNWGMNLIADPRTGAPFQSGDVKLGITYAGYVGLQAVYIYWDLFQPVNPKYVSPRDVAGKYIV